MSYQVSLLSSPLAPGEGCESAYDALKRFGLRDFRPGQREVIERILAGTVDASGTTFVNTHTHHVCLSSAGKRAC